VPDGQRLPLLTKLDSFSVLIRKTSKELVFNGIIEQVAWNNTSILLKNIF